MLQVRYIVGTRPQPISDADLKTGMTPSKLGLALSRWVTGALHHWIMQARSGKASRLVAIPAEQQQNSNRTISTPPTFTLSLYMPLFQRAQAMLPQRRLPMTQRVSLMMV